MSNVAESSNVSKACEVKDIEELMEVLDSSIGKIRILPILYDLFEKVRCVQAHCILLETRI